MLFGKDTRFLRKSETLSLTKIQKIMRKDELKFSEEQVFVVVCYLAWPQWGSPKPSSTFASVKRQLQTAFVPPAVSCSVEGKVEIGMERRRQLGGGWAGRNCLFIISCEGAVISAILPLVLTPVGAPPCTPGAFCTNKRPFVPEDRQGGARMSTGKLSKNIQWVANSSGNLWHPAPRPEQVILQTKFLVSRRSPFTSVFLRNLLMSKSSDCQLVAWEEFFPS